MRDEEEEEKISRKGRQGKGCGREDGERDNVERRERKRRRDGEV